MSKLIIFLFAGLIVGTAVVYVIYGIGNEELMQEVKNSMSEIAPPQNLSYAQEEIIIEPPDLFFPLPSVKLSSKTPKQADIVILSAASFEQPYILFEGTKTDFFKVGESQWLAVLGVDAKSPIGSKDILVEFPNGTRITEEIVVGERVWNVTKLEITKKLAEQGYTAKSIVQTIAQKENVLVREAISGYLPVPYFFDSFIDPLNKMNIVGVYGNIRKSGEEGIQHLGVDLDAVLGTEIFAINDGKVVFSRDDLVNYGKTLIVNHGLGIFSLYLHLSEIKVQLDEVVEKGEIIALSGNTGYSIDPHLHFSMKVRGASIDPLKFIDTFNKAFEAIF